MKKTTTITVIIAILVWCGCDIDISVPNKPRTYSQVPLSKWVDNYYAESEEPNHNDNLIYTDCLEIWYEYNYEKNGEIKFFDLDEFNDNWEFIDKESLEKGRGVKQIKLTAKNPNSNYNNPPQSAVVYELFNSNNVSLLVETTGVVENYWNIALHNTRSGFFKSVFSFPWPTVKFPIEENKNWQWRLSYSSELYGDDRLFNWEGIIQMNYEYIYLGEVILELQFGKVITSKFEAIGTNGKITNRLVYYFNSHIGFVKQEFYTDDGAKIELEAVKYIDKCE